MCGDDVIIQATTEHKRLAAAAGPRTGGGRESSPAKNRSSALPGLIWYAKKEFLIHRPRIFVRLWTAQQLTQPVKLRAKVQGIAVKINREAARNVAASHGV